MDRKKENEMGNNRLPKSLWIGKAFDPGLFPLIWTKKPKQVNRKEGGLWVEDISTKEQMIRLKWLRRYRITK